MAINVFPLATNRTQEFTSSGTWTCPGGVYSAEFLVVGAGGAGGGTDMSVNTFLASGGGGGAGAVKKVVLPVNPGTSYTITIGAKGTGTAASAGGNGGFSEVLNGATVLIRSYGGGGGSGIDATDTEVLPTASSTVGCGGGQARTANGGNSCAGGGGGAFVTFPAPTGSTSVIGNTATAAPLLGLEGGFGRPGGTNTAAFSIGGSGIDGFGFGGGGGVTLTSASMTDPASKAGYSGGAGGFRTSTGTTAGSNALANTGSGGGGSSSHTNTTAVAGGNGADGYVRITYFG